MLAYLPVRRLTASLDMGVPLRVQNNGAVGGAWRSASHSVRIPAVWLVSGVHHPTWPVGFRNLVTAYDLQRYGQADVCHAARLYSWISPAKTFRRRSAGQAGITSTHCHC